MNVKKLSSIGSHTLTALVVLAFTSLAIAQSANRVIIQGSAGGVATVTGGKLDVNAAIIPSGTQNVTGTGTAGSAATGVLTVQGIASATPVIVGGAVASGSTDSGNPVKIGGVFRTTKPTLTDGQRGDSQLGTRGSLQASIFGADSTSGAAVTAAGAGDSVTGNSFALSVAEYGLLFNGSTWDRARSTGAVGTTGGAALVESGPYTATRVTADGQIKGAAGFVHTVCIMPTTATPTAGLMSVYNSLTETGTIVLSKWFLVTSEGLCATLDIAMGTGIYVGYDATLANASVTVTFR